MYLCPALILPPRLNAVQIAIESRVWRKTIRQRCWLEACGELPGKDRSYVTIGEMKNPMNMVDRLCRTLLLLNAYAELMSSVTHVIIVYGSLNRISQPLDSK